MSTLLGRSVCLSVCGKMSKILKIYPELYMAGDIHVYDKEQYITLIGTSSINAITQIGSYLYCRFINMLLSILL